MQGWLAPCVLLAALALGARATAPRGGGEEPRFPSYQRPPPPRVQRLEDGLRPLYAFARSFLHAVQPNGFPGDLLAQVLENGTEEGDVAELVHYEGGYVVCLVLALLYLLLLPLAGALLLGRFWTADPRDPLEPPRSRVPVWDWVVSAALVLTTLLLWVGLILAFGSNSAARSNTRPGLLQLQASAADLQSNLDSIRQAVDSVLDQYRIPQAVVQRIVEDMDDEVGERTVAYLQSPFQGALADFSAVAEDAAVASETLTSMEETRGSLQLRQQDLHDRLLDLKTHLKALRDSCSTCLIPDTSNLTMRANYTLIPSVQSRLDSVPAQTLFRHHLGQSNLTFHSLPRLCSEEMAPITAALLEDLNSTAVLIQNSSQGFPSLRSLSQAASQLRGTIRRAEGPLDHYDHARWAVATALLIVLLGTAVLLLAAVGVGLPVFLHPAAFSRPPHARLDDAALWMFQICVALMCAFSWLYIILVFVTLFFGGNAHTLLCRSFTSGEIFTFLDQRDDLFTSLAVNQGNHSHWDPPRASQVYQGCRGGRSLFHSMDMNRTFDLDRILNPVEYLGGFRETLGGLTVSTQKVQLLSDRGRNLLLGFRETGLEEYDFSSTRQLLSEPVVNQDLLLLARELALGAELSENEEIRAGLLEGSGAAGALEALVTLQRSDGTNMSGRVETLESVSQSYKAKVDATLGGFNRTQTAMNLQVPLITASVSGAALQSAEDQLVRYMDWARRSLVEDVLGCGWLAIALDNMYTAVCLNVVDPWNGFWLSLGWCCAFLVPAVFLSLCVARRLPPHPRPPPQASPASPGDSFMARPEVEEKTGDCAENNSEGKPNIYMTLSELGDSNDTFNID